MGESRTQRLVLNKQFPAFQSQPREALSREQTRTLVRGPAAAGASSNQVSLWLSPQNLLFNHPSGCIDAVIPGSILVTMNFRVIRRCGTCPISRLIFLSITSNTHRLASRVSHRAPPETRFRSPRSH